MAGNAPDIDRLIEDGLSRYGVGDLDGALLAWEQALALDPDNAQANSYVDYVRMNYELLTTELARDEDAPFAIGDDEPEYQIEIEPGEAGEMPALHADSIDEGWFIEPEVGTANGALPRTVSSDFPQISLVEIGEEEPTVSRDRKVEPEVNFDAATREYPGGKGNPSSDLLESAGDPVTSEFRGEETPPFGQLEDFQTPSGGWVTHVRKRDLGFVQPTASEPERPRRANGPPELKMTLRTPERVPERPAPDDDDEPELELSHHTAPPADAEIELSYDTAPADLIESLPSPTPVGTRRPDSAPSTGTTRDLPGPTRPPASPSEAPLSRARTSDFEPQPTGDFSAQRTEKLPVMHVAQEPALRDMPTSKLQAMTRPKPAENDDLDLEPPLPLISAPTRDLGIRPPRASSEDETTINRERALATVSDASPEFDPVDTRTERILADVDAGVMGGESKEDRTRRRITSLFERASTWQQAGDFEGAVAAVDLALAEDPNSALAQKLIHRHRDVVMAVLTAFLGNLDRIPTLARPLHELASAPISPRAAFLLSRVDGILSLEEILDVSGMPRIEAMRYLCQLFLRGILR